MVKLILAFIFTAALVAGSITMFFSLTRREKHSVLKTAGLSMAVSAAAILLLSFFVLLF